MAIKNDRLQRMIQRALSGNAGEVADVTVELWQTLIPQMITVIGERGFSALYARSLYIAHGDFPWLAPRDSSRYLTDATDASPAPSKFGAVDARFTDLVSSFKGQDPAEARKASLSLLMTFTGILASLIGESLTISILRSAWGDDSANVAGEEI